MLGINKFEERVQIIFQKTELKYLVLHMIFIKNIEDQLVIWC